MTVPSGVATLAELEGMASRQARSIKMPNPVVMEQPQVDFAQIENFVNVFPALYLREALPTVLNLLGLKIVKA